MIKKSLYGILLFGSGLGFGTICVPTAKHVFGINDNCTIYHAKINLLTEESKMVTFE